MKKLLLILLLCFPMVAFAQSTYLYNIVSFEGKVTKEDIKVRVDDGKAVETLKNEEGKTIRFKTPAAALMYFISLGWELYSNGATVQDGQIKWSGDTQTSSYWILRKPCTKEEFDKAVEEGVKK